jgi:hypothetical protein
MRMRPQRRDGGYVSLTGGRTAQTILPAAILVLAFWGILVTFQMLDRSFEGDRSSYGDEAPHFLNALMIHDYVRSGFAGSPIAFADHFYIAYPKMALFAWPPLFHVCLAVWMLFIGGSIKSTLLFISLLTAITAGAIWIVTRRAHGDAVAIVSALLFCTLPVTQHIDSVVMLESMMALLSFAFVYQLSAYMLSPTRRNAVLLGLLGAACCLTKGNAVAALASAPLALILAGRQNLVRKPSSWLAAAIVLILSVAPLYMAFQFMRNNSTFIAEYGPWLRKSIRAYSLGLVSLCGVPLFAFVAAGIAVSLRPLFSGKWMTPPAAAMLAGIVGVLGFHVAFPHPMDVRYLFSAIPMCWYFVPATAPDRHDRRGWSLVGWLLLAVVPYLWLGFSPQRLTPVGFREALAAIRLLPDGQGVRALIASNDTGEGAFIAAAADSNPARSDVIVRSSKLFTESDWWRRHIRYLVDRPDQVLERAEALGLTYVVLDRTREASLRELRLIGQAVQTYPERVQQIADFPAIKGVRERHLQIYRFTQTASPPREFVRYRLPYSLGREIAEKPVSGSAAPGPGAR